MAEVLLLESKFICICMTSFDPIAGFLVHETSTNTTVLRSHLSRAWLITIGGRPITEDTITNTAPLCHGSWSTAIIFRTVGPITSSISFCSLFQVGYSNSSLCYSPPANALGWDTILFPVLVYRPSGTLRSLFLLSINYCHCFKITVFHK